MNAEENLKQIEAVIRSAYPCGSMGALESLAAIRESIVEMERQRGQVNAKPIGWLYKIIVNKHLTGPPREGQIKVGELWGDPSPTLQFSPEWPADKWVWWESPVYTHDETAQIAALEQEREGWERDRKALTLSLEAGWELKRELEARVAALTTERDEVAAFARKISLAHATLNRTHAEAVVQIATLEAAAQSNTDTEILNAFERMNREGVRPGCRYDPDDGFQGWEWRNELYPSLRDALRAVSREPQKAAKEPAC